MKKNFIELTTQQFSAEDKKVSFNLEEISFISEGGEPSSAVIGLKNCGVTAFKVKETYQEVLELIKLAEHTIN